MTAKKAMTEYKMLILDMDGTLYYQLPLRMGMVFSLVIYYTFHFWRINELFLLKKFRELREVGKLAESESLADESTQKMLKFWIYEYPLKYVKKFRDSALIDWIHLRQQNGTKIVVYSDYFANDKIRAIGLKTDYSFCATDQEINCLKPDPKGLENILELTKTKPQECLFIGDRYEKDGLCAEGAGVDYVILGKHRFQRKNNQHSGLISEERK